MLLSLVVLGFSFSARRSFSNGFISHMGRHISSTSVLLAKPKRGGIVDSYRTVEVQCATCQSLLFGYKKKNGTKSNLIKVYIERIVNDPQCLLSRPVEEAGDGRDREASQEGYCCAKCSRQFGRAATIKGLPAIKIVGNRVRMK